MDYAESAYEHARYLSETIGGRGSCSVEERRAAEYVQQKLKAAGVAEAGFETFEGAPSTYLPFILIFSAALAGTLAALFLGNQAALAAGALLNLLGVWAMFAETEFAPNWTRWLLPTRKTQNVTGLVPPQGSSEPARQHVVLCAHLDTHRAAIFFSSRSWVKVFDLSVSGAFLSMALAMLFLGLGSLLDWGWLRWSGLFFGAVQIFVLALVISAEFRPFSPGANDNASGAAVCLSLAERLGREPLGHTTVHFVFTDCEETGAFGSRAYLDRHAEEHGKDAVYIILDEVGAGHLKIVTEDGLILKRKTHPRALQLVRQAARGLECEPVEAAGSAYTDALPATKLGLAAIVMASAFPDPLTTLSHWHQLSDKIEFVEMRALRDSHTAAWNILQLIDRESKPIHSV